MEDTNKEHIVPESEDIETGEVEQEEVVEDASTCEDNLVASMEASLTELDSKYKRLQADFDNFRRRTTSEKEQLSTYVKSEVMSDLLPSLDTFERALKVDKTDDNKSFLEGFAMVYQNMMDMLKQHGLEPIDAMGKPFDPNYHQAVLNGPSETLDDNMISQVLQAGYTVDGRVVRPAMVEVVNNG